MKKSNNIEIKSMIDKIFEQREEELYTLTVEEREMLLKKSKNYSKIYTAIENIPQAFIETKEGIKASIENYLEILNDLQGIENKKFYQEGFSDAINLLLNCISNNKNY